MKKTKIFKEKCFEILICDKSEYDSHRLFAFGISHLKKKITDTRLIFLELIVLRNILNSPLDPNIL